MAVRRTACLHAYDPAIHEESPRVLAVRSCALHLIMDALVKPAHDAAIFARPFTQI
jgi:hypothetical protein